MYSITKKKFSSFSVTSKTLTIFLCESCVKLWTSRSKRLIVFSFSPEGILIALIATLRFKIVSSAKYTVLMPLPPSFFITLYRSLINFPIIHYLIQFLLKQYSHYHSFLEILLIQ